MSYILDALKKAQAERELGQIPKVQDLGAQPSPGPTRSATSRGGIVWIGAGIAVACGVGLTALWLTRARAPAATETRMASAPASVPAPATAAAPMAAPSAQRPAAAPVVAVLPPVLPPLPQPSASASASAIGTVPTPLPVARTASTPSAGPGPLTGTSPPASRPAAAADTVIALEALDPALRARLPPLVAGGTIHSSQREQRMVILDGQVLREGDALGADVRVLSIEPQGVVLALGERLGNRRVRLRP